MCTATTSQICRRTVILSPSGNYIKLTFVVDNHKIFLVRLFRAPLSAAPGGDCPHLPPPFTPLVGQYYYHQHSRRFPAVPRLAGSPSLVFLHLFPVSLHHIYRKYSVYTQCLKLVSDSQRCSVPSISHITGRLLGYGHTEAHSFEWATTEVKQFLCACYLQNLAEILQQKQTQSHTCCNYNWRRYIITGVSHVWWRQPVFWFADISRSDYSSSCNVDLSP